MAKDRHLKGKKKQHKYHSLSYKEAQGEGKEETI